MSTHDLVRILLRYWKGDHQAAIGACKRIESHETRPEMAAEYRLAAAHIGRLQEQKERTE